MKTPTACRRRSLGAILAHSGGNTLAIMAASLLPMSAMAGSAIDMSRLYVVKVRLQQACDAGALAGRKFMVGDTLDQNAKDQAKKFFDNNFEPSFFKSTSITFQPNNTADGQVSATASATVPMALMQMFGKDPVKIDVSCEARLDVPDADIMFVLDTTGSMACAASDSTSACSNYVGSVTAAPTAGVYAVPEKGNARIKALRLAVVDFYDTLKSSADPATHVRFGFVPYTSSVNVGYLLPQNFLVASTYNYQSRNWIGDKKTGSASNQSMGGVTQATCAVGLRTVASGYPANVFETVSSWTKTSGSGASALGTCAGTSKKVVANYRYSQRSLDISQYVRGQTVDDPTKIDGSTSRWRGCIEERNTTASTSFSQGSPPADLDIDLTPNSDTTRWRPMWADVIYDRDDLTTEDSTEDTERWRNTTDLQGKGFDVCGKEADRLQEMSRSEISNYVNAADFKAHGGTYHDVGMIWGARFLSPTGPFADDTAAWPNRNPPNRVLIFMTDGDMAPNQNIYGLYGYETLDRRVTGGAYSSLKDRHNTRFSYICEAAKARNITVYVVAFAQTMTDELKDCASKDKWFYASNDAELRAQFKQIASQIAELRLSK